MDSIEVSIICDAYNQVKYIGDALDSMLAQRTTFQFEILVHDDASTDGTADVIASYAKKYPDVVKPYYESTNQYTIGAPHNFLVQKARIKGRYIALCEGDDYWTDPQKLQAQFEILEAHKELDICVHAGERVQADTKKSMGIVRPCKHDCIIPVEEVIAGGGGFVVTNSIFMRTETYVNPPDIVAQFNLDFMVQIWGSMRGGMYYIDRSMSAYRIERLDSWTNTISRSAVKALSFLELVINSLTLLDEQTAFAYTEPLQIHIDELNYQRYAYQGNYSRIFNTKKWKTLPPHAKIKAIPHILSSRISYIIDVWRSAR